MELLVSYPRGIRIVIRSIAGALVAAALSLPAFATSEQPPPTESRVLATNRTSTLEKELLEAGGAGYVVVGMTVSKTAIGGKELVAILKRPSAQ